LEVLDQLKINVIAHSYGKSNVQVSFNVSSWNWLMVWTKNGCGLFLNFSCRWLQLFWRLCYPETLLSFWWNQVWFASSQSGFHLDNAISSILSITFTVSAASSTALVFTSSGCNTRSSAILFLTPPLRMLTPAFCSPISWR